MYRYTCTSCGQIFFFNDDDDKDGASCPSCPHGSLEYAGKKCPACFGKLSDGKCKYCDPFDDEEKIRKDVDGGANDASNIKLPPPAEGYCSHCSSKQLFLPQYEIHYGSPEIYYVCSKCGQRPGP